MQRLRTAAIVAGLTLTAGSAVAALPCAGFGDVDIDDALCGSVEWIRNRGITFGCAAPPGQSAYCPTGSVTRLRPP